MLAHRARHAHWPLEDRTRLKILCLNHNRFGRVACISNALLVIINLLHIIFNQRRQINYNNVHWETKTFSHFILRMKFALLPACHSLHNKTTHEFWRCSYRGRNGRVVPHKRNELQNIKGQETQNCAKIFSPEATERCQSLEISKLKAHLVSWWCLRASPRLAISPTHKSRRQLGAKPFAARCSEQAICLCIAYFEMACCWVLDCHKFRDRLHFYTTVQHIVASIHTLFASTSCQHWRDFHFYCITNQNWVALWISS